MFLTGLISWYVSSATSVGGSHQDLVIWRSSVFQKVVLLLHSWCLNVSVRYYTVSFQMRIVFLGLLVWKHLWRTCLRPPLLAVEPVAIVPSLCSKSLILGFVFNFDRAYLKNIFGLVLTSVAIRFSKSRTAFLTSALTRLYARLYWTYSLCHIDI